MTIAKNILFGVVGTNSKKVSEIDKKLSNNKIKKEGFGALNVVQYSFYGQKNGKKWYDTKTKLTSWDDNFRIKYFLWFIQYQY